MSDFARPKDGFRYDFGGLNINSKPDSIPPNKYPLALNIRAYPGNAVQGRPGQVQKFATGGNPVTDLCSYVALNTDELPRFLARDNADKIWLDTGVQVGTLAAGGLGATMLPVRPNASPVPYIYVANGADYQKFSAPDSSNVVAASKVGIAEPQSAPDAAPFQDEVAYFADTDDTNWANTGTAGAIANGTRVTEAVTTVLADPANANLFSLAVTLTYQRLMAFTITELPMLTAFVQDVYQGFDAIGISAIYYFSGTTGHCVIVPANLTTGPGDGGTSINTQNLMAALRRGSIIKIASECCLVWSITSGPDGSIAIETSTVSAHTTADMLAGVSSISVLSPQTIITGQTINIPDISYQVTAGIGTISETIANPFGAGASLEKRQPSAFTNPAPGTVTAFSNPGNAFDGNPATFAQGVSVPTNTSGCVWTGFAAASGPYNTLLLHITASVAITGDGVANLSYSLNGGISFISPPSLTFTSSIMKQDFIIALPPGQDLTQVRVEGAASFDGVSIGTSATTNIYEIFTKGELLGGAVFSFQPDDYLSIGINVDDLTMLTEMKIQLDIGDGSFTKDYLYYTVRPSDLTLSVANTASQLANAQTVAQRAIIDATTPTIDGGGLDTDSGAQTVPGVSQWTQIVFPIAALTRVGNDQTKSLRNLNAVQILWNALGTINILQSAGIVFGSGQPDVGDVGAPLRYRVRPRSSITGVRGNPSPASRYGINPRRQQCIVLLPSAAYDSQIDTWDIFRYGGAVTSWRYIGSTPSTNLTFVDNFTDSAAQGGDALDFDDFEPWPSIDLPSNGSVVSVTGTTAVVVPSSAANILSYLPGTLVRIGSLNAYTLRIRPTALSGGQYLLQFEENAGANSGLLYNIQEPILANRHLPYMWGPDAAGTIFACGDPFRPGTVYFSKNYTPDSAPDSYNIEICPPLEPLLGGETIDGLAMVASPERWWALYPQSGNEAQRYAVVQQPFTRGLAAPLGHCTDGLSIYWWAKDGIYSSAKGSLTDGDLLQLFPHDGIPGITITYNTVTLPPPDYSRAATFRLTYANSFLYATYQDSTGTYNQLILDTRRMAWSVDAYTPIVSCFYHPQQPAGTLRSTTIRYDELIMANIAGVVSTQTPNHNDLGGSINCGIASFEFDGGDLRAPKQWGDIFVDVIPAAPSGIIATPMSLGAAAATFTTIPNSATRQRTSISVGGVVISAFMGLQLAWFDDFTTQTIPTRIFTWHPSFDIQPAKTIGWTTFGSSYGQSGYMHIREMVIAYVSTAAITLTITSYDGQSPAAITLPSTGGAYQKTLFPVSANKGQLYKFAMSCTAEFQIFESDSEIRVGPWGRTSSYSIYKSLGGENVAAAPI